MEARRADRGRRALCTALEEMHHKIDNEYIPQDRISQMLNELLESVRDGRYGDCSVSQIAGSRPGPTAMDTAEPSSEKPPLYSLDPAATSLPAPMSAMQDLATLKAEHSSLRHRFNALLSNFRNARDALRERKADRDAWRHYAGRLENLIHDAEEEHRIIIPTSRSAGPISAQSSNGLASISLPDDNIAPVAQSEGARQDAGNGLQEYADVVVSAPLELSVPVLSSESTQGDPDDSPDDQLPTLPRDGPGEENSIKNEPSSDTPVFVSERAVRKRKRDDDSLPEAITPRPKVEPEGDSSPILSMIRFASASQENVDLGNIAKKIMTPRKQKETPQPHVYKESDRAVRESATFRTPASATYKPSPRPLSSTNELKTKRPSVLTPLSVNVQRQACDERHSRKPPVKRGLSFALSVLAEDGDAYGAKSSTAKKQNSGVPNASTGGRLKALLDSPTPAESDPVIHRSNKTHRERAYIPDLYMPAPERRTLPFNRDIGASEKSAERTSRTRVGLTPRRDSPLKNSNGCESSPRRKQKEQGASRLRGKPLSELRLEDFKVNPLANDGERFAYSEVVRDRDERACLPGCTDMHCCGKQFRALALSQRPDPPLTPGQQIEEQKLLEGYLGDFAYKLASMSKQEKAELWVEAKTQELANKYGRHRQRFSRMQSPPGFWNADFPDTQELQKERIEAEKRERQGVAERYREATRPNGRWLFRDE
ncbi:hypothetical protein HIM_03724 [Hirsutella minnesotensis 3608]|uniref:DNA endonuclease activator Ctp1 C-terminal domain-containing protein n=1 Tax=Hirsutella minnesotensis 3608 TaxID=1043627 RepID=A0A0F8A295_9HYPO|nr:hypothetical protein HIM_03724 [Hirsutella minnesotensis 3608]